MKKRVYTNWVCRAETGNDGTTKVIASTPTEDRYQDVVAPDWNLERFKSAPIIVWNHDYTQPPIGKAVSVGLDGDKLIAEIRWDDSPTNPLGQTVASQFRDQFLTSVSVGFAPGKSTPRKSLPKDDPDYSDGPGMKFTGNELLEISAVSIPANPEAVAIRARSWGMEPATMEATPDKAEPAPAHDIEQRHVLQVVEEADGSYWIQYAGPSLTPPEEAEEAPAEPPTTEGHDLNTDTQEKSAQGEPLRLFDDVQPPLCGWRDLFTT